MWMNLKTILFSERGQWKSNAYWVISLIKKKILESK